MPREGKEKAAATAGPRAIVHADGTLTLTAQAVEVDVTRGGGFRGLLSVPRERAALRVMGRAVAVYDEGRLVHLCSRCKPTTEVARLVAVLGDRVTTEQRTPLSTLLALREESATYEPPGAPVTEDGSEVAPPEEQERPEIPAGYESLRRVYLSQAAMERDSRRLRAAGWMVHQTSVLKEPSTEASSAARGGRWRELFRAASPSRKAAEGVVLWIRPLDEGGVTE